MEFNFEVFYKKTFFNYRKLRNLMKYNKLRGFME